MSSIFISHSSVDINYAQDVASHLKQVGHHSIFLDFDLVHGIKAGQDWEKELYTYIRKCHVVVVLYSKAFSNSRWCFAEIAHAKALGKFIIPLKIDDCIVDSILLSIQIIDATTSKEYAFQRLDKALIAAGVDKEGWDQRRSPYPGLLAFDERDAPVFFGREEETEDVLKMLRQFRDFGGPKFTLILGASGCGKSSLMRAGVIPRLRKDPKSWIILPPFRPGKNPFEELSKSLATAFNEFNNNRSWQDIYNALQIESGNLITTEKSLLSMFRELIGLKNESRAILLIFIDQIEELLDDPNKKKVEGEGNPRDLFTVWVSNFLGDINSQYLFISTLRSDFLKYFLESPAFSELTINNYIVKSVGRSNLRACIEGPATVAGIRFEDDLVDMILNDTGTSDALPLLAFTLRELWEQHGPNDIIEIDEYMYKLGGLEGSIARAADAVLIAHIAETGRGTILRDDSNKIRLLEEDDRQLKAAFREMVRIDEAGRYTKRLVSWVKFPLSIADLLLRFVAARLLIRYGDADNIKMEVAHEAIFRTWARLMRWLEEDKKFLIWRKRMNSQLDEWVLREKHQLTLLSGPSLTEATEWLKELDSARYNLDPDEIEFITLSNKRNQEEKMREERRRLKELRNLRILVVGSLIITIVLAGFGLWVYQNNIKTSNDLARSYWEKSRAARNENNSLLGLHFIAEGLSISKDNLINQKMLIDVEPFLPVSTLAAIIHQEGGVHSAAFSPDGAKFFTKNFDNTVQIWDAATFKQIGNVLRHDSDITSTVFSPDSKLLLTAGRDNVAKMWDVNTGILVGNPFRYAGGIEKAIFSPDGKIILTVNWDHTAQLWDVKTGGKVGPSMNHNDIVSSAAFSQDGKKVLTVCWDDTARIWDGKTGDFLRPLAADTNLIGAVFSPVGGEVLMFESDKTVRVLDAKTATLLGPVIKCESDIEFAIYSPDGKLILVVTRDGTARVWNPRTGTTISASMRHNDTIISAVFSPEGNIILTSSFDKTARLWDAKTGVAIGSPMQHGDIVNSAVFSPDEKKILSASNDRTAKVWNIRKLDTLGVQIHHKLYVNYAIFNSDGSRILSASRDSSAFVWDAKTGMPITTAMHHRGDIQKAVFSPDEKQIVTVSSDSTARLWNAKTGFPMSNPMRHNGKVLDVAFSQDGKQLATASEDKTARLWDASNGEPIGKQMRHNRKVSSVVFSRDGKLLLTASFDSTICIWNAKTCEPKNSKINLKAIVSRAVFSPDGKFILTACSDGTARLLDAKTGIQTAPSMEHGGKNVITASFSPDGKQILTACADNTARLWSAKTCAPASVPMRHENIVHDAQFSPDGTQVVTASFDNTARRWDAQTGASIGNIMHHQAFVTSAFFSPDGTQLVTASWDKSARIWNASGDLDIPVSLFKLQANTITGVYLNAETRETYCMSAEDFGRLKKEYYFKGKEHYKICKYQSYNVWHNLYPN